MFKQVPKSERIRQLIAQAYGDPEVRLDDLAIYESIAANTLPLRRKTGIFAAARIGIDLLAAMSETVAKGEHIPLQLMHRSGIPAGKVFHTELRRLANGQAALHSLFYLPRSEGELARKIDSGVISEVSVGVESKQMLCSDCGFDYLGASATTQNISALCCSNGHIIGQKGNHVLLHGLSRWIEMSLVDKGAVDGASILARPQQTFAMDEKRGFSVASMALFASAEADAEQETDSTPPPKQESTKPMDELIQLKAELIVAGKEKDTAALALTAAQTELTAVKAKLSETELKLVEASKGDLAKVTADLAQLDAFVDELIPAALAMAPPGTEKPTDRTAKLALIAASRAKLALVPVGGKAQSADAGTGSEPPTRSYAAFGITAKS